MALTPGDFSSDQQQAIKKRLQTASSDINTLSAENVANLLAFDNVIALDEAYEVVQKDYIKDLILILHGIVIQRDIDFPLRAPHFIRFSQPPPTSPDPSFPVTTPAVDLFGADDPNVFFSGVGPYDSPFADASIENGILPTSGGWELWEQDTIAPFLPIRSPTQPSAGELTPAYPTLVSDFAERQNERLHEEVGSYTLKSLIQSQISTNSTIIALIQDRENFWTSIGFTA